MLRDALAQPAIQSHCGGSPPLQKLTVTVQESLGSYVKINLRIYSNDARARQKNQYWTPRILRKIAFVAGGMLDERQKLGEQAAQPRGEFGKGDLKSIFSPYRSLGLRRFLRRQIFVLARGQYRQLRRLRGRDEL